MIKKIFDWYFDVHNYIVTFFFAYRTNMFSWVMGITFGFAMSKAGATTYDYHAKMFLMIDPQLLIVIVTSVSVSVVGVFLMKKYKIKAIATGEQVDFVKKPYQKGLIAGAFLFGTGWGMTASCPGTIPAMLGEGKIAGFFALIGILIGTLAYGTLKSYLIMERRYGKKELLHKNCDDGDCG